MDFIEIDVPLPIPGSHEARAFACGHFRVLVTRDGTEKLWHLSISHPSRYPTFTEIKEARYKLVPDEVTMAMFFPPKAQYVNLHPNCFHLHEVK